MPKCWNILTDSFWVVHQNLPKFQKLNFDENISEKLITYELWVQQHQFLEIFNKMSKREMIFWWPLFKVMLYFGYFKKYFISWSGRAFALQGKCHLNWFWRLFLTQNVPTPKLWTGINCGWETGRLLAPLPLFPFPTQTAWFCGAPYLKVSQSKWGQTVAKGKLKRSQSVDILTLAPVWPLYPDISHSLTPLSRLKPLFSSPIHSLTSIYPGLSTHYPDFTCSVTLTNHPYLIPSLTLLPQHVILLTEDWEMTVITL